MPKYKAMINYLIEGNKISYGFFSVLILSTYTILYKFRFLDKPRSMRWAFAFENVNIIKIFMLMFLALVLAYTISRFKVKIDQKLVPIILFLFSFFIGALFWSAPEINADAARYFTEAKYLKEYGVLSFLQEWGKNLYVFRDFPTVPFLNGLIFKFMGESREYIQIFTTSLFALTTVLTYFIGKKLWNKDVGVYAGLLLISFPYSLSQVPLTLVDIPTMFFVTLAVFTSLNALEMKKSVLWIVMAAISIFLALFSKLSALLMLVTIPIIFALSYIKNPNIRKLVIHRSVAIILVSSILISLVLSFKYDIFIHQLHRIESAKSFYSVFLETPLSLFLFQTNALVTLMAIFSFWIAFRKRDLNYLLLLGWLVIPYFFLYNTRIRYMMPSFPAMVIMASITINGIKNVGAQKFLVSSMILCSLVISIFVYLPFEKAHNHINIKNAAEYTNSLNVDDIEIHAIYPDEYPFSLKPLVALFDIYSNKGIVYSKHDRLVDLYPSLVNWKYRDWTWEYQIPPYYKSFKNPLESNSVILVISPTLAQTIPKELEKRLEEEYRLMKVYNIGNIGYLKPNVIKVYIHHPTIAITSPKGGELWRGKQTITWNSQNQAGDPLMFNIVVYRVSIGASKYIGSTDENSYTWDIDPAEFRPAKDYKVAIYVLDDHGQTLVLKESREFSIIS